MLVLPKLFSHLEFPASGCFSKSLEMVNSYYMQRCEYKVLNMVLNATKESLRDDDDNYFLKLWGCITTGSLMNRYITANTNILTFNL